MEPAIGRIVIPVVRSNKIAMMAFLLGLALSVISIIAVYSIREEVSRLFDDLATNRDVEIHTMQLFSGLVAAETAFRNYSVTPELILLDPFNKAGKTIPDEAAALSALVDQEIKLKPIALEFIARVRQTFEQIETGLSAQASSAPVSAAAAQGAREINVSFEAASRAHNALIDEIRSSLKERRDGAASVVGGLLATVILSAAGLV